MLSRRIWGFTLAFTCFFCCVLHVVADSTDPSEVSALQSVRYELVDNWKHLKNWNKGDPCVSGWTGIHCFGKVGDDGYLHVRELQLLNMNLSGSLSPELGKLSHLQILDFMWNQISGTIPKEIGNLSSLRILVLNGNSLSGPLPDELGYLSNLNRLQVDENKITGPIPKSFANLSRVEHLHMNNNSISGHLPRELASLPKLLHLLLDNNNLSGILPSEYSNLTTLTILQLDNNHFVGAEIPKSYRNYPKLIKLSLRNCSLGGTLPDLSQISNLSYLDLSQNELTGPIPSAKLSDNITTLMFSHNHLNGSVPSTFSLLPRLQILSLENNSLSGTIPSSIWSSSKASSKVLIDVRYNQLTDISGDLNPSKNVSLRFKGNPLCNDPNIQNTAQFCDTDAGSEGTSSSFTNSTVDCPHQECPLDFFYEYVPSAPQKCYCAAPIRIGYRLKSPSFAYNFPLHIRLFEAYVTRALGLDLYELVIDSYKWETGPRLRMYLKIFPMISEGHKFNDSEVLRIRDIFATWEFPGTDFFGPYELLNFTLLGPYESVGRGTGSNGMNKGVLAAIVVGAVAFVVVVSTIATIVVVRRSNTYSRMLSQERSSGKVSIKIEGVREFSFKEMASVTDNFNSLAQVGRGGYGRVYKGVLSDTTLVAIKRAEEGSLQGMREFLTEIQLLSRLHHRNLVALMGYCGEAGEQMLIYEFMPNGTLREWLSGKFGKSLSFVMRIKIALGSAKGILYLHTEASPPIFHRDIKASNILLDAHMNAKVADFGLSKLAPVLDDEGFLPDYVSTVVKGTPGYLDPEYFLTHKLTAKSDVYSLGVVLMELLTGLPPILHGKNLVREVIVAHQSGKMTSMIDSHMGGNYPPESIEKFTILALRCCEDDPEVRPSMLEVVRELEDILQFLLSLGGSSSELVVSGTLSSWYSGNFSGGSDPASSSSTHNTTRHTGMTTSLDVSGTDLTTGEFQMISPR